MIRILRDRSATLTHTFYVDGTATNPTPDSATVTITNDAGTAVVTAQTVTDTGTGTVSYTLTPAQVPDLDTLTVDWVATFGGQSQTFTDIVEVAGGFLFSIAQARAVRPLDDTATYTTAAIVEARTLVEQALEDACGVAFVPRFASERLSGDGTTRLLFSKPRVSTIRSVVRDGVALVASELATIVPDDAGLGYHPSGWAWGVNNFEVAYEHGHTATPLRIKQAALLLLKNWLVDGPLDDRTTSFTTQDGTFALSTPGMRGAIFGIPEVDATIGQYDERAMVA